VLAEASSLLDRDEHFAATLRILINAWDEETIASRDAGLRHKDMITLDSPTPLFWRKIAGSFLVVSKR